MSKLTLKKRFNSEIYATICNDIAGWLYRQTLIFLKPGAQKGSFHEKN